jgi:hypothetical protein
VAKKKRVYRSPRHRPDREAPVLRAHEIARQLRKLCPASIRSLEHANHAVDMFFEIIQQALLDGKQVEFDFGFLYVFKRSARYMPSSPMEPMPDGSMRFTKPPPGWVGPKIYHPERRTVQFKTLRPFWRVLNNLVIR